MAYERRQSRPMTATSINHVSIHAQDLERSAAFYEQLFGMERIPTPKFAFPVAWLRLGRQQLHLFVRSDAQAAAVPSRWAERRRLRRRLLARSRAATARRQRVPSPPCTKLPDGSVQMYLRDPAGNLVEVDWPDGAHARTRESARTSPR